MNTKRIGSWLLGSLIVSSLLCFTVAKRKLAADKALSTVTYAMKHPLHDWKAVSHDVKCALIYDDDSKQIETVAVSLRVSSFDSQNTNRDSHALEVLDALKYPTVTFASQSIQPGANGALTIKGNLTFHGVTKPVVMQATRQDKGDRMTIMGGFDINMTEYTVERPSVMGLKADDAIRMSFDVAFPL